MWTHTILLTMQCWIWTRGQKYRPKGHICHHTNSSMYTCAITHWLMCSSYATQCPPIDITHMICQPYLPCFASPLTTLTNLKAAWMSRRFCHSCTDQSCNNLKILLDIKHVSRAILDYFSLLKHDKCALSLLWTLISPRFYFREKRQHGSHGHQDVGSWQL